MLGDIQNYAEMERKREEYLERPLPSSPDNERLILGAILLDNRLVSQLFHFLQPEDFYSPIHKKVAQAMYVLFRRGASIDAFLVGAEIEKLGHSLQSIGGVSTITNLTYGLPHFGDISDHCKIVKAFALSRLVLSICNKVSSDVLEMERDIVEILTELITTLVAMQASTGHLQSQSMKDVVKEVKDILTEWAQGNETVSSLKTGIPELDAKLKLKGIPKGELTLIGARPSVGKTALLIQIATHILRLNVPVLFISLEMLKTKIVMRMLPAMTSVKNKDINPTTLAKQPHVKDELFGALDKLENLPMHFDRSSDIKQLIATAEFYIQTQGCQAIIFDYLTLIKDLKARGSRDEIVGNITAELKELFLRTNTAGLGAAQLNRASEDGTKPKMTDFRESGMIEQACDLALMPYDPDASQNAKTPSLIEDGINLHLECVKQRDAPKDWHIPVFFDKDKQTFESPQMRGVTV